VAWDPYSCPHGQSDTAIIDIHTPNPDYTHIHAHAHGTNGSDRIGNTIWSSSHFSRNLSGADGTIQNIQTFSYQYKSHVYYMDPHICWGQKCILDAPFDNCPPATPTLCLAYALLFAPWWDLADLTYSVSDDRCCSSSSSVGGSGTVRYPIISCVTQCFNHTNILYSHTLHSPIAFFPSGDASSCVGCYDVPGTLAQAEHHLNGSVDSHVYCFTNHPNQVTSNNSNNITNNQVQNSLPLLNIAPCPHPFDCEEDPFEFLDADCSSPWSGPPEVDLDTNTHQSSHDNSTSNNKMHNSQNTDSYIHDGVFEAYSEFNSLGESTFNSSFNSVQCGFQGEPDSFAKEAESKKQKDIIYIIYYIYVCALSAFASNCVAICVCRIWRGSKRLGNMLQHQLNFVFVASV